mgnify:CR=1
MRRVILGLVIAAGLGVGFSTAWADFTCICYHPVSWNPDGSNPIYVELPVSPGDPCKEVLPESATVTVLDGGVHYCS